MTRSLRAVAVLAFCGLTACGKPPDAPPAEAPPPVSSGALAPSDVSSSRLAGSEAERIRQVLSDLDADRTASGAIVITLPERILFDFDEATIRPDARATLAQVAEVLVYYGEAPVEVVGHTDDRGDDDYNLDLSERRAEAVADALGASFGVARDRLQTRGEGEARPVAPNANADGSDNPEGRQRNRRVEVVIEAEEVTTPAPPARVDSAGG